MLPLTFSACEYNQFTSNGTVYSIASEPSQNGVTAALALTVVSGGKTTHSVLPESVDNGMNGHPTLAYDAADGRILCATLRK